MKSVGHCKICGRSWKTIVAHILLPAHSNVHIFQYLDKSMWRNTTTLSYPLNNVINKTRTLTSKKLPCNHFCICTLKLKEYDVKHKASSKDISFKWHTQCHKQDCRLNHSHTRPIYVYINLTRVCMCVCGLTYPTCNVHEPYCHLWPAQLYNIFPHHLINGTIKKKLLNTKCVFWFSLHLSETFLILRRTEWYMINSVYWSSCKVPIFLIQC
jgi:hypothetical protein